MIAPNPAALMYDILLLYQEINSIAEKLQEELFNTISNQVLTEKVVFGKTSLSMPRFVPASFGFMRTTSWLYVMYYEVGKVNVEFLSELLKGYDLDTNGEIRDHRRTVQQLRTYLQHNLDIKKNHDRLIQEHCEQWFYKHCKSRMPIEEEQWEKCLLALLNEAQNFSFVLRECVRKIEQDESYFEILRIWYHRLTRYHAPYEFSQIITIAATDMGRENLDADRLCSRFYSQWVKELELLNSDYVFEIEARKLIEHVLLTNMTPVLPITGKDILNEFNIIPGKRVGELLQKARSYYDAGIHTREEILKKLKDETTIRENET